MAVRLRVKLGYVASEISEASEIWLEPVVNHNMAVHNECLVVRVVVA